MEKNAKELYEHFKRIGRVEEAEQILRAYPQFEEKKKPDKSENNKKSD